METVGKGVIKRKRKHFYKGDFSRVYDGEFDLKNVIVKRVNKDNKKSSSELKYLRDLKNKNVVNYLYHEEDDDFLYIVLEKCDKTLEHYIANEKNINHIGILWQIVNGMVYIHTIKNLIHRDLKPSNILLIGQDQSFIVKISDFGLSKELPPDKSDITQSVTGSHGYMSPECLKGQNAMKDSDIFSLGLLFVYVLSEGGHAFGDDISEAHERILNDKDPDLKIMMDEYMYDADSLVRSTLSRNPKDRPSIQEIQAHHLFWNAQKKLAFIQLVSDFLIKDDIHPEMQPIFDKEQDQVAPNWRRMISDKCEVVGKVIDEMKSKRQKDGICDLFRNIRNLLHHYDEKVEKYEDFETKIGGNPDGFYSFFKHLFPKLWDLTYVTMKKYSSQEIFKTFYEYNDSQHLVCIASEEIGNINDSTSTNEEDVSETTTDISINKVPHPSSNSVEEVIDGEETVLPLDLPAATTEPPQANMVMSQSTTKSKKTVQQLKLVLRNYQWELAEQALNGKNSCIVAPTGSGKTLVLTEIIQNHLKNNPKGRVMFMAPKTVLAEQQYLFLKKYLPKALKIEFMIGSMNMVVPIGKKILQSQVTVLTPQILINELKRKDCNRYLSFDELSLLVFDECHSIQGHSPPKRLMNIYHDYKDSNPEWTPCQIVGVTASLGIGAAKYKDKVWKNLITLLANLDVTAAPVTVVKNIEELQQHNNKIKESFIKVETEEIFGKLIQNAMFQIEMIILKKILKDTEAIRPPPANKISQAYSNWIHDLILDAKQNIKDGEVSRKVITLAEHLDVYHSLASIKDLVPDAVKAVFSLVNFEGEAQEKKFLKAIYESVLKKAVDIKTPMMDCLENLIFEEFLHNPDARCMVFVRTRQAAKLTCDHLAKTKKLTDLNPSYLLGKRSQEYGGPNPVLIRDNFEKGTSKVLICTSVGEAGLDFPACSLVIMYNYVTGEIGRIQRSGRARASKSRAIIITSHKSDHVKREENNKICAEATLIAIEDAKKKEETDPTAFVKEIAEDQNRQKMERRNSEAEAEDHGKDEDPAKWKVHCGNCKNYLTTGDKFRNLDTNVVIRDEKFHENVKKRYVEKVKGSWFGDADYHCINDNCDIKVAWGLVKNGNRYPVLPIPKIVLSDEKGDFFSPRKKKNLPFKIPKSVNQHDRSNSIYEKSDKTGPGIEQKIPDEVDCIEIIDLWESYGDE